VGNGFTTFVYMYSEDETRGLPVRYPLACGHPWVGRTLQQGFCTVLLDRSGSVVVHLREFHRPSIVNTAQDARDLTKLAYIKEPFASEIPVLKRYCQYCRYSRTVTVLHKMVKIIAKWNNLVE